VPTYAVSKLVTVIKSITAREIFRLCPEVKKQLWGGVVHLSNTINIQLKKSRLLLYLRAN